MEIGLRLVHQKKSVGNSYNIGITRVYQNLGNTWTLLGQNIIGKESQELSGWSVSLSADGNWLAIGAPKNSNNRGITRIYQLLGNKWTQFSSDISGENNFEENGYSVSITHKLISKLAIGAPGYLNRRGITRIYNI